MTCTIEVKRKIKSCYEHFFANEFDNFGYMDRFLEKHKLPNHTQKEIEHFVSCTEIDFLVKIFLTRILAKLLHQNFY